MKALVAILFGILLMSCSLKLLALPHSPQSQRASPKANSSKNNNPDPGEQKFQQNCGRCHHAPESISPREAKAVLQHMRVRAMLSAEDEQLILKYLAP